MKIKQLLFLSFLTLCLNASAQSTGKITLAWDASPDLRVNVYRLYYGPSTTTMTQTLDTPVPLTTATVSGLVNGQTYFFAVTAVDTVDALESIFSNQVSSPVPFLPLPQVTGLKIVSAVAK